MHSNPDFDTQELYNLQRSLQFHLLLPKITAHLCLLAMQDTSLAGVPGQVRWDPPSNTGTNSGCKTHHFSSYTHLLDSAVKATWAAPGKDRSLNSTGSGLWNAKLLQEENVTAPCNVTAHHNYTDNFSSSLMLLFL